MTAREPGGVLTFPRKPGTGPRIAVCRPRRVEDRDRRRRRYVSGDAVDHAHDQLTYPLQTAGLTRHIARRQPLE